MNYIKKTKLQETTHGLEAQPDLKLKKSRTLLLVLVGILVTVILVSWVVWIYSKTILEAERLAFEQKILNPEKQTQKHSEIYISDWKIYYDEEYGFEFKYPETWFLYKFPDIVRVQREKDVEGLVPGNISDSLSVSTKEIEGVILDEYIENEFKNSVIHKKNVEIGGQGAYEIRISCVGDQEGIGCGVPVWYVAHDNKIFILNSNLGYSSNQDLFNRILSTFKFLDKRMGATNIFDINENKVGDNLGEMMVTSISFVSANLADSHPLEENHKVVFGGDLVLEGKFNYYDQNSYYANKVCFTVNQKDSLRVPILSQYRKDRDTYFCFSNDELAQQEFDPKGSSGVAKIVIDELVLYWYPGGNYPLAILKTVLEKEFDN